MLWLCVHLPHLPVELRQPPDSGPVAVVDRIHQRRWVLSANAEAQKAGIHPAMDAALALGREPSLRLVERSTAGEKNALQGLAAWAHQWSSEVCVECERWLIALEIGASIRYFGNLESLMAQLLSGAQALGYTARLSVAPTWEAAALFAFSSHPAIVRSLEAVRSEVCRRPLAELAIPDNTRRSLQDAGLRTIDDVLRIPADALARRFGPDFPDYLHRLLGTRPDPRRRFRPAEHYRRALECSYPIDNAQALLFPLRRMFQELQGYLRGRDLAVESVSITLRHRDAAPTVLGLRMSAPQRDAAVLLPLVRERLERTTLPASVVQIVLKAQRLVAPAIAQGSLFEEHTAQDAQWSQLLDRLRARLGDEAIRELHLLDDHRPERAWCIEQSPSAASPTEPLPERPVWLLDPRPLREPPKLLGNPERIEAGWWEGQDQRRDYYVAETPEGALWWVFRDLQSNQWFLHGIWA